MVNFLKENSYTIVKMLINQLGMTMFGLMLALATNTNETFLLITSLFSIGFYLFLLYSMSWEAGAKDKIRVDSKRAHYHPWKGLWMSLCANSINIVLTALLLLGYAFGKTHEWAGNLYAIISGIVRLFEAMYLGLIQLYSPINPIGWVLILFPAIFVCTVAYYLGHRNFRFLEIFKGKKAKNSNHQ